MNRITILFLVLLLAGNTMAQVNRDAYEAARKRMQEQYDRSRQQAQQQYDDARRKAEAEYAAFRKKANEEYAAAMQRAWVQMGVQPAEPKPKEPAPPRPQKPAVDKLTTTVLLPQSMAAPAPAKPMPIPIPPIPEAAPEVPVMQFTMYGTSCVAHVDADKMSFRLSGLDEKSVAAAWKQLSQEKYDGMLHDCLAQREAIGLSDWGYVQLVGRMSDKLLGKGSNEAVLLQMYLLTQSGYRVRVGCSNNHLVLLVPFNRKVYNYSFVTIDGVKHYAITNDKLKGIRVCDVGFPREQVANIMMGNLPTLSDDKKRSRTVAAERFGTMKATVAVDEQLINYLNDYPLSDSWDYYALAGLSDGVKASLYPALQKQIEGKSKKKAAAMLLDFVQTGFDYATDQEQFGYERPLFGDESFYYPKNDCEDRSILYSILVRDLLKLDVVLVNWPGHIATAVAFPEEVEGDYYEVDGRRFTICDPTYIGAGVGATMPDFQNVSAKLVRL